MPSRFWGALARALLVPVLGFPVITCLAASILWLTIPAPPVPINVRWRPHVADSQRVALERRFGLTAGHQTEGTTWAYTLADASASNIRAIVQDESVADTAHVNRRRFRPAFAYDRPRRILVFAVASGAVGSALLAVRGMLFPVLRLPVVLAQPALVVAAAAPPVILAGAAVIMLVTAVVGYQPLWQDDETVTLPRAAAAGDRVRVSRLIGEGSDPNAAGPVPLDERVAVLTPLEAAVVSRDLATVVLLVDMGASVDGSTRVRLACLARDVGARDIVDHLQGQDSAGPSDDICAGVPLPVR